MQSLVSVPSDLHPWVEAAVVVHAPATLAQSRFPAMVSSMLVLRLAGQVTWRDAPVPPSVWISASTAAVVYAHGGPVHAVGLVLRPAAAAALWLDARGLVNTLRPLPELAGPRWGAVEHAVWAAADDSARVALLCQFIRQLVAPPSSCEARRQQALSLLQAARAGATGVAAERNGLSRRQLERRFAAHWGMSPKRFQVIERLNGALGQAVATEPGPRSPTGAALAVDQGYYDQSHLARDVRRLAGHPLQSLVEGTRSPHTAHWPLQVGAQALQTAVRQGSEADPRPKR